MRELSQPTQTHRQRHRRNLRARVVRHDDLEKRVEVKQRVNVVDVLVRVLQLVVQGLELAEEKALAGERNLALEPRLASPSLVAPERSKDVVDLRLDAVRRVHLFDDISPPSRRARGTRPGAGR